ncbi:uncharacterized protein LOC122638356 [Telopea speciosissima]|uniref:uncharacterized protein LOC122638356 n=1 Tax=Telopea speciosissima TaxID=54955 RepID=UPI001CC493E6|nr:uncharacterized protein LOC122638356 [Telopea speciosissima]
MDARLLVFVATTLFMASLSHGTTKSSATIVVMGVVYCDTCSNNTFSRHSYFLPGVKVHVDCELNANSPTTTERLSFSVNRTTDRFGVYKLEIASVDGFQCAESSTIQTFCKASLIGSSTSSCNVPGLKTTAQEMVIKSKQVNLCIYSLGVLNYKPPMRNKVLCGN